MLGDLIGEFRGRNTAYRVLSDGKLEVTTQGTGKILGMDAFIASTTVGAMENGVFTGEVNCMITTMEGDAVMMKACAAGWSSEKGGVTRAASYQITKSQKLMRLTKMIGLHEYETDMKDEWTGKIWEWK